MRAAPNADALGLVSEFGVHVVRPADMDTRYTQLAHTVGLAVRAAFEQGRSVVNKYSGSSHVLVLQGYSDAKRPRGFAGGALAALIKDFLVPWLAEHAFNGAKPRLKQLTISRNQLAHSGQPQKRSLANLWHYDSLPNRLAKVLLYLSDVDERHACMAVMRRALLVPVCSFLHGLYLCSCACTKRGDSQLAAYVVTYSCLLLRRQNNQRHLQNERDQDVGLACFSSQHSTAVAPRADG